MRIAAAPHWRHRAGIAKADTDLGVQRLDVRACLALLGRRRKDVGGTLHQLGLPLGDWFGWTSKRWARAASVWSPFTAAIATFALNAA